MKYLMVLILLTLFLFNVQIVNAEENESLLAKPIEVGSDMIVSGLEKTGIKYADNMYNASGMYDNSSIGHANALVLALSTHTYDAFNNSIVGKTRDISAFMYVFIVFIALCLGGAYTVLNTLNLELATEIKWLIAEDSNHFSFSEYVYTVVMSIVIPFAIYLYIYLILALNQVLTQMVTVYVIDTIVPTMDNAALYIGMAQIAFGLSIVFAWRDLVIFIICAVGLILGGFYVYKPIRRNVLSIFRYFTWLVFLQFILVTIAGVGLIMINSVPMVKYLQITYFTLMLMLFFVSLYITSGWVLRTSSRVASRAVRF